MNKIALGLAVTALLAISSGLAMTAPASATPLIIRDTVTISTFEPGLTDDCRPGLTGTLVGTGVISFQSVETAQGFPIHVTSGGTGRIQWCEGSYTLIDAVDHSSGHDVGQGTGVFTETHTDGAEERSVAPMFRNDPLGLRGAVHAQEHQGRSRGHRP
jgi:hypothetical protein